MGTGSCGAQGRTNDLLGRRVRWLLWGVPALLLAVGGVWDVARPWLWVPALAVGGIACLANAARCGRLHCFLTGPLFLLGAVATVLDALGTVTVDSRWILGGVLGGLAIGYGLEWVRGKYAGDTGCA